MMPQVCRTCLEEVPEVNCIRLNNSSFKIKEELRVCLPEVDVDLVPDAVMCIYCVNELHSSYDFKQKCLFTEKQIRTQLRSQVAIDLAELKKASEVELLNGDTIIITADVDPINNDTQDVEMNLNGITADETINNEDDDDEDDADASNMVLGLCESAPREHPPVCSTSKAPTNNIVPATSSISSHPAKREIVNSARKSTTKSAHAIMMAKRKPGRPSTNSEPNGLCCSVCNALSPDIQQYIAHAKTSHKEENYYKCPICMFTSKAPGTIVKHYETRCANSDTKNQSTEEVSYKCPHCDFATPDMKILNKHMDTHILKCNKCYYVATNRSAYQKHLSTHTFSLESDDIVVIDDDEDNIKCSHCNFIAKSNQQFEDHNLKLHGIKFPYVCNECGYTAATKASLIKHSKFHLGNRIFRCNVCSYNCDLLYNLKKHLASRHNQN